MVRANINLLNIPHPALFYQISAMVLHDVVAD
jgi:hypothetical protein